MIAGLEPLLPEGAATAQDAGLILRVAVAAARQGDRERLRSLERRYRTMRGQAARALEALVDAPRDPRVLAAVTETVSTYSVIEGSAA